MQLAVVTGLLAGVPLQDVQRDGSEKIVSVLANPDFGVWTVKRNVVAVLTKSRVIEKVSTLFKIRDSKWSYRIQIFSSSFISINVHDISWYQDMQYGFIIYIHLAGECTICEIGFIPPRCLDTCLTSTWGQNCNGTCYCFEAEPCNLVNGTCPGDCDFGHTGETCSETCIDGQFGVNCASVCGRCENEEVCSPETGECLRCQIGYQPSFCNETCLSG